LVTSRQLAVDVRRVGIDVDIDSDNSGQIDGSVAEENLEDDPYRDGKYIAVAGSTDQPVRSRV
jgi:hypothetical protein